ncbi:vasculin-like protein 1 [Osmerus mordax]|uniref:vasculin-like protein 1 n=1 Tax=Osmerus mordax TaxID=8014 RepID=UPI00350EFDAF
MAQHDFVPAWLNFSKPLPTKSPGAGLERHGHHLSRGDARSGVNRRRRHYSSDGFFNYDLRASAGDGWQHPSLLRHDSVDSGVARGGHGGLGGGTGGTGGKETPGWHSGPWGPEGPLPGRHPKRNGRDKEREKFPFLHQRNGNFHPHKGEDRQENKLKFVEEDFPSLNPEMSGKPVAQIHAVGTPTGVWENPPSAKQTRSKMLVIKKVSKTDPSTPFSAGFANTGLYPANSTNTFVTGPSVHKNLIPKPATAPIKTGPWKPNGRESKSSLDWSGKDSAFTSPAPGTKPATPANTPTPLTSKEPPSSTTPPIDITPSRLKLMRRTTDRRTDILRGLKDWRNGDSPSSTSPPGPGEGEGNTPEPKDYDGHENGISHLLSDSVTDRLSSSLEEEHRLLKAMGWQEHPENDDNFLPLTEDELREFQAKSEQLKRNGWRQNDVRVFSKPRGVPLHLAWRNPVAMEEGSESETSSSSQTSGDEADT